MEVKKEDLPKSRVKLTIEIPHSDFEKFYNAAYQKLSAEVAIRGFRKGKAPRNLAEAEIGQDKIFSEALDQALPETYYQAVTDLKITPIMRPNIKIIQFETGKPLQYEAEVDVLPKVSLGNYKSVRAKMPEIKVETKEIDQTIDNLAKSYAKFKKVDRPAKIGDKIEIDFAGFLKHVKLDKLTSKNHPIVLGETKLIPGFEKNLIGLKKGETKKFKIKFPSDHPDKLIAGKEVEFEAKVHSVEEVILPKIDDEFAKKISKFKTLTEMKEDIKKAILARKKQMEHQKIEIEVVQKVADQVRLEIPKSLSDAELERMISDLSQKVQMQGLRFEDYLKMIKKTQAELQEDLRKQADNSVKINLVISSIRDKEGIKVSNKDIEKEIEHIRKHGQKVEDSDDTRRYIGNVLANRKTVDMLVENVLGKS